MNPPVLTQFAMPDPNASPLNLIQLFQLANTLVNSTIQGSYIPYVIQTSTPSVDDQDKAWIEIDASGRPKAIRTFYSGHWRRVYNGMLGEIRGFSGDPGYGPAPKNFDVTGLGNIGGDYDGWGICDGRGGRPDLSDHFLIGAHMNNASSHNGYDPANGGWVTWISNTSGQNTGGVRDFTLGPTTTYIPPLTDASGGYFRARRWDANNQTPNPHNGSLWGIKSNQVDSENDDMFPQVAGNTTPTAVSIIPDFIALGWIVFVGYA